MTRISKEPEVRKQEILEAAITLFYEKGYEKTSMTDIADKMKPVLCDERLTLAQNFNCLCP